MVIALTKKSQRFLLAKKNHHDLTEMYNTFLVVFGCPNCDALAFFPYGEEEEDLRQVRRYLCKQCGYYLGPEGEQWALYDPIVDLTETSLQARGCWQLEKDASEYAYLPQDVVENHKKKVLKKAGIK